MKKMLSLLRSPTYYRMCQQTFTVQNKPAAVAPEKAITSFLRFWNWAEENCRCSQNLWQRKKMLLKQKPSKHS